VTHAPGQLLDEALLEELGARWRDQRAPIAERLQPGLSDGEMDALTAPVGLHLPAEARIWWGWHDGVPADPSGLMVYRQIGGAGLPYLPLADAVTEYRRRRALAAESTREAPADSERARVDFWWDPTWLPVTYSGHGSAVAIGCEVPPGTPSPVRVVDWEDMSDSRSIVTPSLRTVVTWWIEALDSGSFRYDQDRNVWTGDPDATPPERRRYGIA